MPQPSRTQVHIDAPLTSFGLAYISELGYVANRIPVVRVPKQSDKYYIYDKDKWFRDEAEPRGDAAESVGGGFTVSNAQFFCDVLAYHQDVGPQARDGADMPIDLERDAARFVSHKMALKAEKQFAAAFIGQSAWGGSGAPSNLWDTVASTPIEDVRAQSVGIVEKTGFVPNTLIVGAEVHTDLVDHPDILDRIKYTQRGVVNADLLAALFEVDNYWVVYASENTAQEQATASYDFIGNSGKNALLCYLNPSPSLMTAPTALTRFQWKGVGITREPVPLTNGAIRVEAEEAYDMKVTGSDLGYEFTSAVS